MLLAVGTLLLVAGFIYDVLFAGIPYQDPTPEVAAGYEHHSAIATVIYGCCALIFVAGLMAFLLRYLVGRKRYKFDMRKTLSCYLSAPLRCAFSKLARSRNR